MKVDRTPFTVFDFIGYFVPGFLFSYFLYLTFDIDFTSILQIECKSNFHYEHAVFSLFMLIFSWFVGHLLSWMSHVFQNKAEKIFGNDEDSCPHLFDLFCQGKRRIFCKTKNEYEELLNAILDKMFERKCITAEFLKVKSPNLFLKSISYYMDENKWSVIYNYLVIQGAFRAFTFSFILHAGILCATKNINCLFLEPWVNNNFWWILLFDGGIAFICWNIYLKYYRRQIEENVVFLIHKIYGIYGKRKNARRNGEVRKKREKI